MFNKIKSRILKIKGHKECKRREILHESKFNLNKANITRKILKEVKTKFIDKNRINKIGIIQNKNYKQNKTDSSLNIKLSKYSYNFKTFNIFLYLIILFINLIILLCECSREKIILNFSEIILKINGTGNITILSDNFFQRYKPDQIYIVDSFDYITTNEYYFTNTEIYTIRIKWNNILQSTNYMFLDCNKIIEIDLSNFNSSKVNNMY